MKWNGKKLNVLCDRRSVSPAELAERLGVSRQAVYGWLSGREPRGSHLLQLTEFLKIDPAELYDRESVSVRQKYIENLQAASVAERGGGRLFKRSGVKLIYAILIDPMLGK